jgi:hypothetical protein
MFLPTFPTDCTAIDEHTAIGADVRPGRTSFAVIGAFWMAAPELQAVVRRRLGSLYPAGSITVYLPERDALRRADVISVVCEAVYWATSA